ncbi:hypothetical protein C7476_103290 [Phyllobacterium bourgognense]|uniref:Uncharacterized protein n=1 Tax=Phyllobacterium bourgognense TaxID=314236 RepID=A0A368Z2J0_9HYPH|nr:hypothetical protein C7476_103290 [Phyllobacterium bourgognense]
MALSPQLLALIVKAATESYVQRKWALEQQIDEAQDELEALQKPRIRVPALSYRGHITAKP